MADYINNNILCQAYVHVEPDCITDELVNNLKLHLNEFVKSRAEFFLYPNADIDIELKDGSIKVYATILGTVSMLFAGVSQYPEFREGAILMYEDVKRLSDYIATESIFSTRAKHNQVIRIEARTGVIGSIKKIVNLLDLVRSNNGVVFADTLASRLNQAATDTQKLLGNLKSKEDEILIKTGINQIINELPRNPKAPKRRTNSKEQIELYNSAITYIKEIVK